MRVFTRRVLKRIVTLLTIVIIFTLTSYFNNQTILSEEKEFFKNNGNYLNLNDNKSENLDNMLSKNLEEEEGNSKLDTVNDENTSDMDKESERKILIRVGEQEFTAVFYNNDSTKSVFDMLPFTLNMADMNSNEKFYNFDNSLPTNSNRVGKINNGDLMLYGSDCLVLFYESFSTMYSYTPLGYIENPDGLKEALGEGNVTVTFSDK